jgi:hypothetical protein
MARSCSTISATPISVTIGDAAKTPRFRNNAEVNISRVLRISYSLIIRAKVIKINETSKLFA